MPSFPNAFIGNLEETSFRPDGEIKKVYFISSKLKPVTLYVTVFPVIRSFRHKGLEKYYKAGRKGGITAAHSKRLRLILGRLDAAHESQDMNLPGPRLHKLTGKWKGYWAVDVSGNWRVVFEFHEHSAWNFDYIDFH